MQVSDWHFIKIKPYLAFHAVAANVCPTATNLTRPISIYGRGEGVSVTGGYVYRGCHFPNLRGLYIYGDYGSGYVYSS